ncbi:Thioredoxin-like 1-2,chloroplastic [Trichinella pseudospiralis]
MSEGGRSNDSDGMASTPSRPRSIQKNTTFPAQMTDVREKCRQMLLKSLEPDLNSPETTQVIVTAPVFEAGCSICATRKIPI